MFSFPHIKRIPFDERFVLAEESDLHFMLFGFRSLAVYRVVRSLYE